MTLLAVCFMAPGQLSTGASPRGLLSLSPRVSWPHQILPDNIVDQRLPMVWNPHYGLHAFALGRNGSLWHKFQNGPVNQSALMPYAPMSEWMCLTPNASMVWGNDPTVALNADGRIELFVGYKADSYDLWQMYQTDAKDPLAWSKPRGPTCMCAAVDPKDCPWCWDCDERPECYNNYWSDSSPFTTSDPELLLDPATNLLKLHFRNFDGHVYQISQKEPSNSTRWSSGSVQYSIME